MPWQSLSSSFMGLDALFVDAGIFSFFDLLVTLLSAQLLLLE